MKVKPYVLLLFCLISIIRIFEQPFRGEDDHVNKGQKEIDGKEQLFLSLKQINAIVPRFHLKKNGRN